MADQPLPIETFAEAVHRLRRRAGLTLAELGRRVGRTRGAVRAWEHGAVPRRDVFPRLASALGVPEAQLRTLAVAVTGLDTGAKRGEGVAGDEVVGRAAPPTDIGDLMVLLRRAIGRVGRSRRVSDPVATALAQVEAGFVEAGGCGPVTRMHWRALTALLAEVRSAPAGEAHTGPASKKT